VIVTVVFASWSVYDDDDLWIRFKRPACVKRSLFHEEAEEKEEEGGGQRKRGRNE